MKNLGSETNVKIYQEKNFWNIIRILFLTNNHYRATLRFARNDGGGGDCGEGDCGEDNRLPRCARNDGGV